MIVKTVRDREKRQDGKLKNEKNGWLGRAIRFFVVRLAAHVSNGLKSRIHPVVGRI